MPYDRLCITTGARPRDLPQAASEEAANIVSLRDSDSVAGLATKLQQAQRVMVVGNGGISLELMCAARSERAPRVIPGPSHALLAAGPETRLAACTVTSLGLFVTRASAMPSLTAMRCAAA